MVQDTGKGGDLAGNLKSIRKVAEELSDFLNDDVRPLLKKSKTNKELEAAMKGLATPRGGKGLRSFLKHIVNRVSYIRKKSSKKRPRGR